MLGIVRSGQVWHVDKKTVYPPSGGMYSPDLIRSDRSVSGSATRKLVSVLRGGLLPCRFQRLPSGEERGARS